MHIYQLDANFFQNCSYTHKPPLLVLKLRVFSFYKQSFLYTTINFVSAVSRYSPMNSLPCPSILSLLFMFTGIIKRNFKCEG
jgi:hypothetical protein